MRHLGETKLMLVSTIIDREVYHMSRAQEVTFNNYSKIAHVQQGSFIW